MWPEEIREPDDLSSAAPVTEGEVPLAEMLMEQLAGVDIESLHDEYAAALEQLVVAKMSGTAVEEPTELVPAVDLLAAPEASIRAADNR